MAKVPDKYLLVDPWRLVEEGFHPDRSRVSESLFALANEHQGLRGHFDEGYSGDTLIGGYLSGVYEEHRLPEPPGYRGVSDRIAFMVNTVNWVHTAIELDGEPLDLHRVAFSEFRRELDFREGELRREFVWRTATGKHLRVAFGRLLSMGTGELAAQRITLTPVDFTGPVTVTLGMDFSVVHQAYRQGYWSCPRHAGEGNHTAILGVSRTIGQKVYADFRVTATAPAQTSHLAGDRFAGQRLTVALTRGEPARIEKMCVLHAGRDPHEDAADAWARGAELSGRLDVDYAQALADNRAYWRAFWERSDIVITDDPPNQQGIRFCVFQLQQTYRGVVPGANIGAKGLTGEFYNGNAFWDTEVYCLPYYLFDNPRAARALIDYRYRTLPQAMARARELDCAGACFPIATTDGTESCTLWQHASLQFQPTTAVAYAIFHYATVTGDEELLYGEGAELLVQICRFLASRGQWSAGGGHFGYYAVMGPDEFQMMVNHNCYTNLMAQQAFRFTARTLDAMREARPGPHAELMRRLACTADEVDDWRRLADAMLIPYDPATGVFEQHQGFFDLPHVDVDAIPVEEFPLYHTWSYDRIYRNDMIKQPDVLMFMLLHNRSFTPEQKRANYDYYEPRCIHESSLSPSVHSILAAELGRMDEAVRFFEFATRIDLDNYNRNTAEGIHISSVAAAWMNIVYGFGGMRSDERTLLFAPSIPEHWTSYSFQVTYRGALLRVAVTQDEVTLRVVDGEPVTVAVHDQTLRVDRDGVSVAVKR